MTDLTKKTVSIDVAKASALIQQHRLNWFLVDNLYGGTEKMRAAGSTYLPQEPDEDDKDYCIRLNNSTLDNYLKQSIKSGTNKVFSKDIQVESLPVEMTVLVEDIDSQQRNLTQFSKEVFEDALLHGVSYILVDYPKLPLDMPFANKAQEMAAGSRPYWVKVSSSSVLEARSQMVRGAERLVLFRFQETFSELKPDGIGETTVVQVREYSQLPDDAGNVGPVIYRLYREDPGNKAMMIVHEEGEVSIDRIPVSPVYTKRTGFYMGQPPMMELAELNVQHWRNSSDLNNIVHVATVPFLLAKGLVQMDADGKIEGFKVNVRKAINTPNADADVSWIEHTGSAIGSAMAHLDRLEERMEYLACQLTTQASSNVTATQAAISAGEANSDLKSMALQMQDGINLALSFTADYLDLSAYGRAVVNTSFSVDFVSVDTFAQVLELFKLGIIDRDTLIAESKRRNVLDMASEAKAPEQVTTPQNTDAKALAQMMLDAQRSGGQLTKE